MELTKNQRRILEKLKIHYPDYASGKALLDFIGLSEKETLEEIKILEDQGLVECLQTLGDWFPVTITITPKGLNELKLRETWFSRIGFEIKKHPIAAGISVITLLLIIWSIHLAEVNLQLTEEVSELQKPILSVPDTRVFGGYPNQISFVIYNPSETDYVIEGGGCTPKTSGIFSLPPVDELASIEPSIEHVMEDMPLQEQKEVEIIKAHEQQTRTCNNNFVTNPTEDLITEMTICIRIKGMPQELCEDMRITVIKT